MDGNEVFEQVTVGGPHSPFIALRVVNTAQPEPESGSASGSGETPEEEKEATASDLDCFLGFSSPDSEPMCFPSTNFAETRFQILH